MKLSNLKEGKYIMEKFEKKGTESTPYVGFNFDTGVFEIKGRSIPENSIGFYQPISLMIEEYLKAPKPITQFKIQLEYYNSSSAACLLNIFRKMEKIQGKSTQITISWYYEKEDEDTLLAGKNFESILAIPFKMIQI